MSSTRKRGDNPPGKGHHAITPSSGVNLFPEYHESAKIDAYSVYIPNINGYVRTTEVNNYDPDK